MQHRKNYLFVFVLLSALYILLFKGNVAHAATTSLNYSVDNPIKVGQEFTITINASNVSNLYGASIKFGYDASLLEILDISEGTLLSDSGVKYSIPVKSFDNSRGVAEFYELLLGSRPGLSGSGSLFKIRAKALRTANPLFDFAGGSSASITSGIKLVDNAGAALPYSSSNLIFSIIDAQGAEFVSDTIPSTMEGGKSYNVSVTVKNTGAETWSDATNYRLGAVGDSDPFLPNVNRVSMNSTTVVKTNETVTFNFTMLAPIEPGDYTSDWSMVQDFVKWFGPTFSKKITVTTTLPSHGDDIVSYNIPDTIKSGQTYDASITVKNTGWKTWTEANRFRLGAAGDSDPFYTSSDRIKMTDSAVIKNNNTYTFNFKLTAPKEVGTYTTDWQMVQDDVTWFGPTVSKQIQVLPPDYGAQIVSNTIPAVMEPGKAYNVSVTVKNTGTNTWTSAGNYKLGAEGESDPFYTTGNRLLLNSSQSVAYGNTATFNFTMTAPLTEGTYTTDWKMLQENITWFGDSLSKQVVVKPRPAYDAEIVSDTIPTNMEAGKSYTASITIKNLGSKTWTKADQFNLGSVGDSDPFYRAANRIYLDPNVSVPPDGIATFNLTMIAPPNGGNYVSDWKMVQDGVTWFGPTLTKNISVTGSVPHYLSENVSDTIPATMIAGKSYNVSVTVKNIGGNTWSPESGFKLGAAGDNDPFLPNVNRILMTKGTKAEYSDSYTFNFTMTAPSKEGSYTTDWQMVHEGYTWFGATLAKTVNVLPADHKAQIVSDTIPTTMEPGKSYNVSVTLKNTGGDTWTTAQLYKLGALGDSDPFFKGGNRVTMSTDNIAYGSTVTFNFTMTAPYDEGTYTSDWRMVHDGVAWFGDSLVKSITVKSTATPYAAEFVSDTIPATMTAGQSYNVSITVKNTGGKVWSSDKNFKLGAAGDSDPFYKQGNRILMNSGTYVINGDTVTFNFTMTAPSTKGTYTSDWQMVQEYITWFGNTLTKQITVQ